MIYQEPSIYKNGENGGGVNRKHCESTFNSSTSTPKEFLFTLDEEIEMAELYIKRYEEIETEKLVISVTLRRKSTTSLDDFFIMFFDADNVRQYTEGYSPNFILYATSKQLPDTYTAVAVFSEKKKIKSIRLQLNTNYTLLWSDFIINDKHYMNLIY